MRKHALNRARRGGKKKERGKSYKSVYFCRKLTERRTVPSSSTGHSTSSLSSLPFSVFNTCRFKGVGQHSSTISDALLTRCSWQGEKGNVVYACTSTRAALRLGEEWQMVVGGGHTLMYDISLLSSLSLHTHTSSLPKKKSKEKSNHRASAMSYEEATGDGKNLFGKMMVAIKSGHTW